MYKYTCFVISPIGKEGTDFYQDYKDLLDLIVSPALEIFDMEVKRGDHAISEDKIDTSVIKSIQDADVCICDITEPNPNVYYELGRRDETGKPVLLLKRKGSAASPVDIATRRFFEYDWNSRYGIRDAQNNIREFVRPMIEQGFAERGKSATLGDIAETLSRLERKVDRINAGGGQKAFLDVASVDKKASTKTDPMNQLRYALMQRNIPLAEDAMQQLKYRMEKIAFYDQVVEPVAAMGSETAGTMLIDTAEEFFDSDVSVKKKTEYLGCLVSYLNKQDMEGEYKDLLERLCDRLEISADNDTDTMVEIYNQKNRLYYGLYGNTEDLMWLDKAIEALMKALELKPEANHLYYNLSVCYRAHGRKTNDQTYYLKAKDAIEACLERDTGLNGGHLEMACRIYMALDDERLDDTLAKYAQVDPYGAQVLAAKR